MPPAGFELAMPADQHLGINFCVPKTTHQDPRSPTPLTCTFCVTVLPCSHTSFDVFHSVLVTKWNTSNAPMEAESCSCALISTYPSTRFPTHEDRSCILTKTSGQFWPLVTVCDVMWSSYSSCSYRIMCSSCSVFLQDNVQFLQCMFLQDNVQFLQCMFLQDNPLVMSSYVQGNSFAINFSVEFLLSSQFMDNVAVLCYYSNTSLYSRLTRDDITCFCLWHTNFFRILEICIIWNVLVEFTQIFVHSKLPAFKFL
jgi:hypothetical protein